MSTGSLTKSLRETLAVFEGSGAPLATTEIADELDLGRRSTYDRLMRLVEDGWLETKKVGANARVWWRPPSARLVGEDWSGAAESLVDDVLDTVAVGLFVLDEQYNIAWINAATEEYFGIDRRDVLGRDKQTLIENEIASVIANGDAFAETVLQTYEDNTHTERFECRITSGDDRKARWLEHRSRPIESGEFAGGRVELYYDITERKESEQYRREFASLVDAVKEYAIFTLDTDGCVRTWNPGAKQINGYDADEVLGKHFSEFYTEADQEAGVPEENLSIAATQGTYNEEGWRVRADGSRFWASVTITAIRDEDGTLDGYAKVTRDMSARREYEQKLRKERDLIEQVFETVPVGIGILSADGELRRANGRAKELLGLSEASLDSDDLEAISVYDENGNPIPETLQPPDQVLETGEPIADWKCQIEGKDGEHRWLSVNAALLSLGDGNDRVILAGEDISQLKEQANRLEKRRDELETELQEVFERVGDAFYAVDQQFQFTYVNERAEQLLQHTKEELLGRRIWEVFPEAEKTPAWDAFQTALEQQTQTSFEFYFEPLDFWVKAKVYPSESGLSVYFEDVTEQKEREQELERYEKAIETIWDGLAVLDGEGRFVLVNDAFCSLTGYDRAELIGEHVTRIHGETVHEEAAQMTEEVMENEREFATLEFDIQTASEETVPVEGRFGPYEDKNGAVGRIGVVRDISKRRERERKLKESERRYRTLVENYPDGAVALFNEDFEYTTAGGQLFDQLGISSEEPVGSTIYDRYPDEIVEQVEPHFQAALEGESNVLELQYYGRDLYAYILPVGNDEVTNGMVVVQDITARKQRERTLQKQVREQEVVTRLGERALEDRSLDKLMAETVELVSETLGADYCKVLDLDTDAEQLLLREGVGWNDGIIGEATVSAIEDDSQAAYTLAHEKPVVVEDLSTETRFSGPDLLTDHDVTSGISVVIGSPDDPWGILGVHDTDGVEFTEQDANFVQSVANILASAIDRHRYEKKLVRQREELAAINSINEVVREIHSSVIEHSTREEIEQTVCEHLAAADSYQFAWIGEADITTQSVSKRAEANTNGYVDEITISLDPDDEHSQGPTGRALTTGEIQTCRDIHSDPQYEPWCELAETYGFQSSAAIPITYEGTTYGVLNVYSQRQDGFTKREQEVLSQLGESIGHTIVATERKRALLSDELVELEFHIADLFETLDVDISPSGQIALEEVVPLGDEEYLVYGTASSDAVDSVYELTGAIDHWDEILFRDDGGSFELRLSNPPVLSTIASLGGSAEKAVIEDGDYHMTVHASPNTDVGLIIDSVRETYPNVEMVARRQIEQPDNRIARVHQVLEEELTDRQRAALQSAFHAGFFEWPRKVHAETVAESLDIAPATFSQHLRKAERKVFEALLANGESEAN